MINVIWLGLIVIGVVVGMMNGNLEEVTNGAIEYANSAVELSLGLIGIMTLWLGMMKIAEEAGLVKLIGKALKPVMKLLFPEVPADHPAMGAMVMNMAANMLGLGNAATPFGIKAMKELQKINQFKDTASDAMCTFLAINTSSVTIIPTTVIAMRVATGSKTPTDIIGGAIFATLLSTTVAIIAVKTLRKLPRYQVKQK